MDDQDPAAALALRKLVSAVDHTAEQAEILEAGVAPAEDKVAKIDALAKAARQDLAEAKRSAKAARSLARDYQTQLDRLRKSGASTGDVTVAAGLAEARGAAS